MLELLELLSRSADVSSAVLLELFDECLRQGFTLKQQQTGMKLYNNASKSDSSSVKRRTESVY